MLITTTKKAGTLAEADAVLQESFALQRPFGVPTLVMHPEFMPDRKTLKQKTQKEGFLKFFQPFLPFYGDGDLPVDENGTKLKTAFQKAMKQNGMDRHQQSMLNRSLKYQRSFCDFMITRIKGHFNACCSPYALKGFHMTADFYTPSTYRQPVFNTVLAARHDADGRHFIEMSGKANPLHRLPGYASHWQTMAVWHEYAHGCGAGEIQADKMAATMCRKAFANQRFINAWADSRAYTAMLAAKTPEHAEKNRYHWGIVEAIDDVMALDQGVIDAMPEDDIRDMRFLQSPNQHTPLHRVSAAIHTERAVRTLLGDTTFFDCTLALLNRGAFRDKQELRIASRFLLACARLTIGGPAYDEPDDAFKYRRRRTGKPGWPFV